MYPSIEHAKANEDVNVVGLQFKYPCTCTTSPIVIIIETRYINNVSSVRVFLSYSSVLGDSI